MSNPVKSQTPSLRALARFALALFLTSLRAAAARRRAFMLQVAFMALNNLVFFCFWWLLFQRVPAIGGWRLGDMAVLFGVVAAGFGLAVSVGGGARQLGRYIDEGELDSLLAQPKPTLLYAVGLRSQASGLGDCASGVLLVALSGVVPWWHAPWVALSIVASATMFLACGVLFNSLAFWIPRTESLARQLLELVVTFSLYPDPLFGGGLRLLLFSLLPAGFVGYLPADLVREPSLLHLVFAVSAPVLYLAFAAWVFGRGLRRYASGSRFGVFS